MSNALRGGDPADSASKAATGFAGPRACAGAGPATGWVPPADRNSIHGLLSRIATAAALAVLLPACAVEGDFGRPQTFSLFGHPLDAAYWNSIPEDIATHTRYGPTADEKEMRKTAYRLRVQIQNLRPVRLALAPQASYAAYLTRERYAYGPSRMAKIDYELHADHQALTLFGAVARRVAVADRQRMQALAENAPYLRARDRRNARNRVRRNCAFMEGTFAALDQRIAAYDYAIDRTRIETPGASPFAVEGSLNNLRDRAASLHYELIESCRLAAGGLGPYGIAPPNPAPGRRRTVPPPPEAPLDLRPGARPFK